MLFMSTLFIFKILPILYYIIGLCRKSTGHLLCSIVRFIACDCMQVCWVILAEVLRLLDTLRRERERERERERGFIMYIVRTYL